MKLMAIQIPIAWEDKPANFQTARRLIAQAGPDPDSLLVLPEMFATGFSMNTQAIAEDYGGPTEQFLSGLAVGFRCWVLAGAAMRGQDERVRNKALAFSPDGQLAGYYAKRRPFTPGGEGNHHAPGEKPALFRWLNCNVSPLVCYDLRFPELFREAAALWKPELFAVIANWPDKRIHHWIRLLQARAVENQAYVLGVNRIGTDPYYNYPGRSLIIDPQGEILADAGEAEGAISAELDLELLRKYRQGLPFLEDLRTR
jgi:predicted amidohydrolase